MYLKQDTFISYSSMDQNRQWVLQAKINIVPELCSSWKSWVEFTHSSFPVFASHHIQWLVVSFSINITSSSLSVPNSSHNLSKKALVVALDPDG